MVGIEKTPLAIKFLRLGILMYIYTLFACDAVRTFSRIYIQVHVKVVTLMTRVRVYLFFFYCLLPNMEN